MTTRDRLIYHDVQALERRVRRLEQASAYLHEHAIGTHDPSALTTAFDAAPLVAKAVHLTPFSLPLPMRLLRITALVRSDGIVQSNFAMALYRATSLGGVAEAARAAGSASARRALPRFALVQTGLPSKVQVTVADHVEYRLSIQETEIPAGEVYAIGWQSDGSGSWRGGDLSGFIYRTLAGEDDSSVVGVFASAVYPGKVSENGTPFFMLRSAFGAGAVSA